MKLTLSISKMNSFRHEMILHIVAFNDETCSMIFMRRLYLLHDLIDDMFLFQSRADQTFTTTFVIKLLRSKLHALDYIDHYSEHFFRCDVVTSARDANLSNFSIQFLDR